MSVIYRAPAAARIKLAAKGLSVVPPAVLGAVGVKFSKISALSLGLQD